MRMSSMAVCLVFFVGGVISGFSGCSSKGVGAIVCGNNIAEMGQICDGTDLRGETCASIGLGEGTLLCRPDCSGFDARGCSGGALCGNDVAEAGEVCDGRDLRGETCESLGLGGGTIRCLADCSGFDVSGCEGGGVCGNNIIDEGEVCDGSDLDGETCGTQGFYSGSLSCLADCSGFDTSGCYGYCGDGEINGGEICDRDDLGGETCESLGKGGGTLVCLDDCSGFDTSGCGVPVFEGCDCIQPGDEDVGFAEAIEICDPDAVREIEIYGDRAQMAVFENFGGLYPRTSLTHEADGLLEDNCRALMLCTGTALDTSPVYGTDFGNLDPHPLYGNVQVHDLGQIIFHLTVPMDAQAVSFDFMLISSEYPQYVCTQFNDTFLAIIEDPAISNGAPTNISFDDEGTEFSINSGYFETPDEWTEDLSGTGYDTPNPDAMCTGTSSATCTVPDPCPPANNTVGSGTGWLRTYSPVTPGADSTIAFAVYDDGDGLLDTCVIIDNFRWHTTPVESPFTVK